MLLQALVAALSALQGQKAISSSTTISTFQNMDAYWTCMPELPGYQPRVLKEACTFAQNHQHQAG